MHHVDQGSGRPVVLLHGEPTWGYLWRQFISPLAREHRVLVPDHMGFGKSETTSDRNYLLEEHVDNLENLLVDELDLRDITLVLHDWGGLIGGGIALRHPDRVAGIFTMNTLGPLGLDHEIAHLVTNFERSAWFTWVREAIADGSFEDVLGNAAHSVVHLMLELQGIVRTEVIDGNWIRAYSSPFTTRAECRGAILLPQQIIAPGSLGIPSPIPPDPEAVAGVRKKPAMLAYGMQDRALLPEAFVPLFEQSFPGRTVIRLEQAGHFCQEDAPDVLVPLIETFVALGSASDVERGGS
ncbi:MAG TPA: alpha/beta fold hydrolase [Acidimicrobiales bacterium]|nr:alpha/beta fold hydrolase [Acidimicrobiales bacterium]